MSTFVELCCNDMGVIISDNRNNVYFDPVFREFYIQTKRKHLILDLVFCPWCGTKFPKSLREDLFNVLETEFKIETNIGRYKKDKHVPPEFKTDEWWKKRGL